MKRLNFLLLLIFCFILTGAAKPPLQTNIKAVVFDFNGVIIKTDKQAIIDFIAQSLDISADDAKQAMAELKKQRITENQDEEDFWVHFAKANQRNLPPQWQESYRKAKISASKEIPGMVDIVIDLQKQGFKTALLTNSKKQKADLNKELGLYELFEPAIFAYKVGMRKPNPMIYFMILDRMSMAPEKVLFIDNKAANVATARRINMDAIEFVNPEHLIEALKKRGIEIHATSPTLRSLNPGL